MKKQFATNEGYIVYCDDNVVKITTPKSFFIFGGKTFEISSSNIKECKLERNLQNKFIFTFIDHENKIWQKVNIDDRNLEIATKIKNFFIKDTILKDFTLIDFETTGLDFFKDDVIEIGAIKVRNLEIVDTFSTLCNPYTKILNSNIHNITNKDVECYKNSRFYIKELMKFIDKDIIAAYNAPFDITFLNILQSDMIKNPVFDLLNFAKSNDDRKSFKLEDIKKFLNLTSTSHRAISDCEASLAYYKYILEKTPIKQAHFMSIDNDFTKIRLSNNSSHKNNLLEYLSPTIDDINKNNELYMKNICFTGFFENIQFEDVFLKILNNGGILQKNVTLKTNYLIVGKSENETSNKNKALQYNEEKNTSIKILTENEFIQILENI